METNVIIVLIWCAVVFAICETTRFMHDRLMAGTETLEFLIERSEETGFGKAMRTRLGNIVMNTILTANAIFPVFSLIGIVSFGAVIWWASINLVIFAFMSILTVWLSNATQRYDAEDSYDYSVFLSEVRKIHAEAEELKARVEGGH